MLGLTTNELEITSTVEPSPGAFATTAVPMLPLPPGMFST